MRLRATRMSVIAQAVRKAFSPLDYFRFGEPGVWYDPSDFSTLFQDASATTPVTALEQPVGLMLDKRLGKGSIILSGFQSMITRNDKGTVVVGGNSVTCTCIGDGYFGVKTSDAIISAPNSYIMTFSWSGNTKHSLIYFGAGSGGGFAGSNESGTSTAFITPGIGGVVEIYMGPGSIGDTVTFTNISVKQIPGNHAKQTTATSRPVLSARVNLLTKTDQFASWSAQTSGDTVSGTKLIPSTTNTTHGRQLPFTYAKGNVLSVKASAAGYSFLHLGVGGLQASDGVSYCTTFNLTLGTIVKRGTWGASESIVDNNDGTYTCTVVSLYDSGNAVIDYSPTAATNVYSGDGVSGVNVFWASLVPSGMGSLPYQRVNTASDYDTAGFPIYLKFNGIESFMVTNVINFSGTDKMTVWAGVRKLSDSSYGCIAELSSSADATAGGFAVLGANSAGYYLQNGAPPNRTYGTIPGGAAAPITDVFLAIFDRALLDTSESQGSRNGGAWFSAPVLEGWSATGNFVNAQMYIGRRGGTSLPFNGNIYQLIVRGAKTSAADIGYGGKFIATKTGVTL